jgi:hypothetical protein
MANFIRSSSLFVSIDNCSGVKLPSLRIELSALMAFAKAFSMSAADEISSLRLSWHDF